MNPRQIFVRLFGVSLMFLTRAADSGVIAKLIEYKSLLGGFSIQYPANWYLDNQYMENKSIKEDRKSFTLSNYDIIGEHAPKNSIILEISVFRDINHAPLRPQLSVKSFNNPTKEDLKTQSCGEPIKTERIDLHGKAATRAIYETCGDEGNGHAVSIYYRDGIRAAIFDCYADHETPEIDPIINSFKFI